MSLTAGVAMVGAIGVQSIGVSATAPTGGTAPYAYQWQYQWLRGSSDWIDATGTGVTTLVATVGNLGPTAAYNLRLKITDHVAATVETTPVSASTLPRRWHPQLRGRRLRPTY